MKYAAITFSPTGGTQKVTDILAAGLADEVKSIDLTDRNADFAAVGFDEDDVALIAVPSYGGRVPALAIERLAQVHGGGARAVLVCVYGNHAYEDTLAELEDATKATGFRVVAAVAAIAEHSIVHEVASGRPDAQDAEQLGSFAEKIAAKLAAGDTSEPSIPGNRPYKQAGSGMVPQATEACVACGVCAARCPVGAIDPSDPAKVDAEACIGCMRCIAVCPRGARKVDDAMLAGVTAMLTSKCSERRECELYL